MLKNSAAGPNVAGGLKGLKFHSCLRLLAPSYIVTSGLVGLLLLLEWEIQVEVITPDENSETPKQVWYLFGSSRIFYLNDQPVPSCITWIYLR